MDGTTVLKTDTISEGAKATTYTPPKANYNFKNWYADAGLTSAFNFDTAITADTVIYAKFVRFYTISFIYFEGCYGDELMTTPPPSIPNLVIEEGMYGILPSAEVWVDTLLDGTSVYRMSSWQCSRNTLVWRSGDHYYATQDAYFYPGID
jgi:hypothetical protein